MAAVLYTKVFSAVIIFVVISIGAFLASAQDTGQPAVTPTGPPAVAPVPQLEDNEYCFTDDHYISCPPGYYMCDGGFGCCDPCPENTFQLWYNTCPSCVVCTDCKKLNKMTVHTCNTSRDTVCGRKLPLTTTELLKEESSTTEPPSTIDQTSIVPTPTMEPTAGKNCTQAAFKEWWIVLPIICSLFFMILTIVFICRPDAATWCNERIQSCWQKCCCRKKKTSQQAKKIKKQQRKNEQNKSKSSPKEFSVPMLPKNSRNGTKPGKPGRATGKQKETGV